MNLVFDKMHGLGNDFVVFFTESIPGPKEISKSQIKTLAHRNLGVGADQILWIAPSTDSKYDYEFKIWNQDGSLAKMCGNGLRCAAHMVWGRDKKTHIRWKTPSGLRETRLKKMESELVEVQVDMGKALDLGPKKITLPKKVIVDGTRVNVGNPHFVFFTKSASGKTPLFKREPLSVFGHLLEKHRSLGAGGSNIELLKIVNGKKIFGEVWERGSGKTQACGTGACASVFASVIKGFCDYDQWIQIWLPGGSLKIKVAEDHTIQMIGPSEQVFSSHWTF